MGLRDYQAPSSNIKLSDTNSFDVRGLTFADISKLATKHGAIMTFMYARFMDEKSKGFTAEGVGGMIVAALDQFPEAVAYLIALAADEPDLTPIVLKLRPSVQAEAIEQIIAHTFVSEAEIKKLVEIATRMFAQGAVAVEGLTAPLPPIASGNGNGAFASR